MIILLSSLPKSFESFVVAVETRDVLPLISVLKVKLLEECERCKLEAKSTNQQAFLASKKKNNQEGRKNNQETRKKVKCFKCVAVKGIMLLNVMNVIDLLRVSQTIKH